jgi:uncharacterized protein
MAIDAHAHLFPTMEISASEGWWDAYIKLGAALSNRPEEVVRKSVTERYTCSKEHLIGSMNQSGIKKTLIYATDWGLANPPWGGSEVPHQPQDQIVLDAVKTYPDRLLGVFCIDPRRGEAVRSLETAVKEWGMVGLKIHPSPGFYPNCKEAYRLYEKALELRIPVIIHTGPEVGFGKLKYGQPIHIDDIAVDFPDLTIQIAHAGLFAFWQEAVQICACRPNVCVDLAGMQPWFRRDPVGFYQNLRTMVALIGPYRILWGTDYPVIEQFLSEEAWLKAFLDPPESVKSAGLELSARDKQLITEDNAARIWGLTK